MRRSVAWVPVCALGSLLLAAWPAAAQDDDLVFTSVPPCVLFDTRQTTKMAGNEIREFDVVVRSAEEKFVVLLPRTHFTGSLSVATRIWQQVQKHSFILLERRMGVGVSMGVSFFPNKDVSSADKLIDQANQALCKAQEAGNNQICLYQHTTYFYRPDMGK